MASERINYRSDAPFELKLQSNLEYALSYARNGIPVLPLVPGAKQPLTAHGAYDATIDEATIRKWWTQNPPANIGVQVGVDNGIVVIDVDNKGGKDGDSSFQWLCSKYGVPEETFTAQTPNEGSHYYYRATDALREGQPKAQLAEGIDFKHNGYVVAAPSRLSDGGCYTIVNDALIADFPEAWVEACLKSEPDRRDWDEIGKRCHGDRESENVCEKYDIRLADVLDLPQRARATGSGYLLSHPVHGATGKGNLFINPRENLWCCYRCGSGGDPINWVAVREGFVDCNQASTLDKETFKKCLDVLRREGLVPDLKAEVVIASPGGGCQSHEITLGKHLSDIGNAERFVERFGESVRYCKELNAWFTWDGYRWVQDRTDKTMRFAMQVPSVVDMEVGLIDSLEGKSEHEKRRLKDLYRSWARTSEYKNRLSAMLDLAKTFADIAIRAQQWDCDRWLLNVRNGTLNLKTGELREHNREDYITKLIPIDYDATALDMKWEAFLNRCVPNEEVRSFLQRASGYSLTGLTVQEAIFFLYGEPATGKSTFLEALLAVLGDYGIPSSFHAFLTKRDNAGGPREDVTRLNGARMVLCSEVNRNTTWNAALIKSLSSGDTMTARNPYAAYSIEFQPIFKLWLGANYRPKCDHDDEAVFRRFYIVPFNVQIPKEERDRGLKDYFKNDEEARQAILAWAVKGCLEWAKLSDGGADGLQAPKEISAATSEYQKAMHPLYDFIKNECKVGCDPETKEPYEVAVDDLWGAFIDPQKHYYYDRSVQSLVPSKKSFGKHLSNFGFTRRRATTKDRQYYWVGLRLLEEGEDNSADSSPTYGHSCPNDSLLHPKTENFPKEGQTNNFPVNEGSKGTSSLLSEKLEGTSLVRIKALQDVPTFVDVDGTSRTLKEGGLVDIPKVSAEVLVKRNLVELVKDE